MSATPSTLTHRQIGALLDMHGIRWHMRIGVLMAWEEATRLLPDGTVEDASSWVPAPTTRSAMLAWLGY